MIYFDNGATTYPKPKAVADAVDLTIRRYGANPGRSGHDMSLKAAQIVYDCRVNAAKLFDIENPENIIFTNNCTTALNIVIKGLLKEGDHVVISSLEHNAVVRPLEEMKKHGVDYSVAKVVLYDDEATIDNFRNEINERTKLIICTGASNVFGVRLPVERIAAMCRIFGILFCVDAAQTSGLIPVSLKNSDIDYYCTAGHKGLYGPMGTGILIVNSKTLPESLIQGGTGSESINMKQPEILPDKYESGTPNLSGIAGLNEGIKFVLKRGAENIERYEMSLAKALYKKLSRIDGVILYTESPESRYSVPVISFNIRGTDSETVAEILNRKFGIAVRAGLHCAPLAHKSFNTDNTGTVRAVVSVFTTKSEVDNFAYAVSQICKKFNKNKKEN